MKRTGFTAMVFIFFSCGIVNDDLPELTSDQNIFAMYVDGQRWVPSAFSNFNKQAYYYPLSKTLHISATNTFLGEQAGFDFYLNNMSGIGNYHMSFVSELADFPTCDDSTRYDPNNNCLKEFKLAAENDSFIEIIEFDTVGFRVSGYFDLLLANDSGDKIRITEGRFGLDFK